MEAAIAAMSAGNNMSLGSPSSINKREFHSTTEDGGSRKKSKTSNSRVRVDLASSNHSSRIGKQLLARTLEEAHYSLNHGRITDTTTKTMTMTSKETSAIRRCFVELVNAKRHLIGLIDQNGMTNQQILAILSTLNFADLLAAANQTKIRDTAGLQILRRVKIESSKPRNDCTIVLMRTLQCLDTLYSELLAVNATMSSGTERSGVLPTPAAYIWCTLAPAEAEADKARANPLLSYLKYRQKEAVRLGLPRMIAQVARQEGLRGGPDEGTMRGTCPVSCPTLSLWRDACRDRICQWSAFACPDKEAVSLIGQFCPPNESLLELGAGTGYWAHQLRKEGVRVVATDKTGSSSTLENNSANMNEYHGWFPHWSTVQPMSASFSLSSKDKKSNGGHAVKDLARTCSVLLLVYPPPNVSMAADALRSFQGDRFIYVGEFRGDTGDKHFETALYKDWTCQGVKSLPNWGNTAARLSFWIRKQKAVQSPAPMEGTLKLAGGCRLDTSPMRCSGCDKCLWTLLHSSPPTAGSFFYRDRLTRCVFACSEKCTNSEGAAKNLAMEARERHLQEVLRPTEDGEGELPFTMKWKKIYCK